jgi:hypothetical protein
MSSPPPVTPRRRLFRKRGRSLSPVESSDAISPSQNAPILIRGTRDSSQGAESSLPPSSPLAGPLDDSSDYDVETDGEIPRDLPPDADGSEGEDLFGENLEACAQHLLTFRHHCSLI